MRHLNKCYDVFSLIKLLQLVKVKEGTSTDIVRNDTELAYSSSRTE